MKLSKKEFEVLSKAMKYHYKLEVVCGRAFWNGDNLLPFHAFKAMDKLVEKGLFVRHDFTNNFWMAWLHFEARNKLQCRNCDGGRSLIDDEDYGTIHGTICPLCEGTCIDPNKLEAY